MPECGVDWCATGAQSCQCSAASGGGCSGTCQAVAPGAGACVDGGACVVAAAGTYCGGSNCAFAAPQYACSGCALPQAYAYCGTQNCLNATASCETCAAGCANNCSGACVSCTDDCNTGCKLQTHHEAYAELASIDNIIKSADGAALIRLIIEELDRFDAAPAGLTPQTRSIWISYTNVGNKILASHPMSSAKAQLENLSNTLQHTISALPTVSAGDKALKTVFTQYANTAREFYETEYIK